MTSHKKILLFSFLTHFFGIASLLFSLYIGMFTAAQIGPKILMIQHASGYNFTTFTISKFHYYKGDTARKTSYDRSWIVGYIGDQNEKLYKYQYFAEGYIFSIEDMKKHFNIGQQLSVLYNPKIPESWEIRIVYPDKDFEQVWKEQLRKQIKKVGYYLLPIPIIFCILSGVVSRKTKATVLYCCFSLLYIMLTWSETLHRLIF